MDPLKLAGRIATIEDPAPSQACLLRAVSTAYYALFHLLISEATLNWGRSEFRSEPGRIFDHGKMKNAAIQFRSALESRRKSSPVASKLHHVVDTFIKLQQHRNRADYGTSEEWNQSDTIEPIADVEAAFESWKGIRDESEAPAFLVSMLGTRMRSDHS